MIKNEILVQCPTRVDFAGGTLDCWPINALLSPVSTINVAISIYTTCRLSRRDDQEIHLHSRELQRSFQFANLKELLSSQQEGIEFFKEHIAYWKPDFGFNLSLQSDSPVGGGLGGSSSLSVAVFQSFMQALQVRKSTDEIVRACAGIEAKILKMPTGTQDYIPAILGGLNIIDYHYGLIQIENRPALDLPFADHLSVFFTGKAHFSGINNWQVMKKFIDRDPNTMVALEKIRQVADEVRAAILAQSWSKLPHFFRQEYEARMMLAESFSSPEIEKLSEVALANGAEAVKICGAGGGGSVFIWSPPEQRQRVIDACIRRGFQHLDVQIV